MLAKTFSVALKGLDSIPIEVEVDVSNGMQSFNIVGLADNAIKESKERISSAIRNLGSQSPLRTNKKIVVNLAPANIKKTGSNYDLAIALGYLLASGQIAPFNFNKILFIGELSLEGELKPISGVISFTEAAEQNGFQEIILPWQNINEAMLIRKTIKVVGLKNLKEVIDYLEGRLNYQMPEFNLEQFLNQEPQSELDFSQIKGQELAKRALIIAAAGGHNVLMVGTPGSGKTLLAKSFINILPPLSFEESLEVTKIYSSAGLLSKNTPIIHQRPFRAPHHSASLVALVGGGTHPKPGEISLAHRGILFLDELPEFSRQALESLRQPLEEGRVTIARAEDTITYPAKFILIAAMNPCPCGWLGDSIKECNCSASNIIKYKRKVSGPLLDRIDLQIRVDRISFEKANEKNSQDDLAEDKQKIIRARQTQEERFYKEPNGILLNSEMNPKEIEKYCVLDKHCESLLKNAMEKYGLTMRSYHRILKISRTIADLDNKENIEPLHINEAIQYKIGVENNEPWM